jgi:hypothetical protein
MWTSICMVKPCPLALLAVTHGYKRTPYLWLEQFQIDAD